MTTEVRVPEPGLRERKKAATRQALHEAAVRLAIAHGADKITVEAVADEAGVSRRTFSNYFANKEEALLHGDQQRIGTLIGLVRARPPEEEPWVALTRAAERFYEQLGELDPQWVAQSRLLRTQRALAAQQVSTFAALERELAAAVGARITEADPLGIRARLMAATFMTAMRVSLHVWLEAPEDRSLLDVLRRSLAETGRGFAR
ncbi:TetR family transcriptional regulator [Actinoplanes sp. NBRC 14428]|uniref:TetR family transcriptional regulator n=1 Tax=Pseudosporangium ferrugineum TaxID=439699 RepID=A0A2T0S6H7_9ACTN|nr:TetR/AcrR family transcriptional regulator [Pseudosporangium ferrugineum]PRY29012.1 TetR family transcriptional regulator [Pseudosporangium ferrugineum]BCJ53519.1 TetR family transcriptional regulator [Actinoplanes sp. NBRC 14428]